MSGSSPRREEGMGSQQQNDEEEGGAVQRWKVAAGVTMDLDILDCPICCHPLRPPVFQCTVGHTLCAFCHDKLSDNDDKCHFCSLPTVYSRCHMVEGIIESIKVACSNVNHGCTARITYYQKKEHEEGCEHAPCFCPIDECGFSGPTKKLLDHLSGKHKPPTKVPYKQPFLIRLKETSAILVGEDGHMFLVTMLLHPIGGVILVCCIQGHSTGSKFKCRLAFSEPSYSQDTEFLVNNTNLRDRKLQEDCILPFVVPKLLLWGTGASATAKVKVSMEVSMVLTPQ